MTFALTSRTRPAGLALAALALVSALSACGGGDGAPAAAAPAATVQIQGTAATGAAIGLATVTAVNASGQTATATTGADGRYTLQVADGAPYALTVTDAAGHVWYSYAPAAGTANITPLTTLALLQAHDGRPLDQLVADWSRSRLDAATVQAAAAKLNANLQGLMRGQGVDPTRANVFADAFAANGQGLDAVLDAMRVTVDCNASACTQRIAGPQGERLVQWNGNIATTGIIVSWSGAGTGTGTGGSVTVGLGSCKAPVAGTYSLLVDTTVSGLPVAVPQVCIDGLPDKPAAEAEFCNAADVQQQLPAGVEILRCSFAGNTGTIAARITAPVVVDYSVTYTYVRN